MEVVNQRRALTQKACSCVPSLKGHSEQMDDFLIGFGIENMIDPEPNFDVSYFISEPEGRHLLEIYMCTFGAMSSLNEDPSNDNT